MPSKEYYEGRDLERLGLLHEMLKQNLALDSVTSDGSTQTKGDVIGVKNGKNVPISVKNASGKNTQVHLPTLNSFAQQTNMPEEIKAKLEKFFGTNNDAIWTGWLPEQAVLSPYEKSHRRLKSANIESWTDVENWFNNCRLDIAQLLVQYLKKDSEPVVYLVWVNKKTKAYQIIDVDKLISWISDKCTWVTTPGQTVLRCNTEDDAKPIFTLQMKGSRIKDKPGCYDRNPQFHLYPHWPADIVLHQGTLNEKDSSS